MCDFLLVINSNLNSISRCFQVIADYWSNWAFDRVGTGTSLWHTHSGWTPKLTTTKYGLKKLETSLYRVMQNAFRYLEPFRRGSQVWRTDRRANGRTDGPRLAIVRSTSPRKKCELIGCTESNRIVFFSGESPITAQHTTLCILNCSL